MSTKDQLPSINLDTLSQVTGGGSRATTPTPATSGDDTLNALTGILSSLQSLTQKPCSGSGFNQQEMLLIMMMMQQRNQQVAVAAPVSPWSPQPIVRYY